LTNLNARERARQLNPFLYFSDSLYVGFASDLSDEGRDASSAPTPIRRGFSAIRQEIVCIVRYNNRRMPMLKTPTKTAYENFDAAYDYFNKQLFGSRLPPCLITVRPHRGAFGYFSSERFGSRDGKEIHDEIALNIKTFQQRSPLEILSTLVHEMVHLEQF